MPDLTLTPTRLFAGIWEGELTGADADTPPDITVTHLEQPVEGVKLTRAGDRGQWLVQVPVPVAALADGVQVFLITEAQTGTKLTSFTIIAGEAPGDDMRAGVALLRAELDLLKKAFRRHCNETQT